MKRPSPYASPLEVRELIDRKIVGLLRFLAESARANAPEALKAEDFDHYANILERHIDR